MKTTRTDSQGGVPMDKTILESPGVMKPRGIMSQGVKVPAGDMVFVSGQVGRNAQGEAAKDDIRAQTRQALENVRSVLEAAGATLDDVVKVTVFVTNVAEQYAPIHEVRAEFFRKDYPASTLVEVKALADKDFLIEIEAIAVTQ
jgi:reactive intermediate/imine deaminase